MNPNSSNQWWSKFSIVVSHRGAGMSKAVSREELKVNLARFARKMFGSAGQMRFFFPKPGKLQIEILCEKSDGVAHDPYYCEFVRKQWTAFLVAGFGASMVVEVAAKLMAGSTQDGKPAEQMMILPGLPVQIPSEVIQ